VSKLFDLALPAPAPPRPKRERQRRREEAPRATPTAQAIWSCLLDNGADPLVLASLLREQVSAHERRRAYYELVHQVGAELAQQAWDEAFSVRDQLSRRAFPVGVREIAEAALGQPLVGIHVVTGELVDLVAARLGTPAFNLGSEVFLRTDALTGESRAILVHEAVHAAQQEGAAIADKPAPPSRAAEKDAHRALGRLGPLGASERILKERARALTIVRAALGRAPSVSRQPLQVAAYEPTPQVDTIVKDAGRLADAVVALLERNAAVQELKAALGPVAEDDAAARTLKVALQLLADRRLKRGANARAALADKLGALTLSALGFSPGKRVPSVVKGALESRLGRSFDDVRLHDDEPAAKKTRAVDAVAVTQGRHVYFAPGRLDPGSVEGRRLLAHELAHVAQQAATPATSSPAVSAAGSPVELEAERVGEAFARGEPAGAAGFTIREQAPSGTLSRDDGKQRPSGTFRVKLLGQTLPLDLATAVDSAVAGRRRLQLGQTRLGPLRIQNVDVELDGATVKRGFLNARIDDGRFKGSTANLIVDGATGQVSGSGSLDVVIQVPGALAKKVTLQIGEGPIRLSVPLDSGDFLSRELPIIASAMNLAVQQGADALEVSLDGSAQVGLDKGFAGASGTLRARLGAGSGGVALDATIVANLKVPGLGETEATLHWDGKQTTLGLKSAVEIRGLSGTAQLTYKDGKLSAAIPDLKFDAAALQPLKLGPASIENGKLKAHIQVADGTTLSVPGARAVLGGASKLDLDGDRIAGRVVGKLQLGPPAPLFSGSFDFAFTDGSLDGQARLEPSVRFFTGGVTVTVKGLGSTNDFTVGGDVSGKLPAVAGTIDVAKLTGDLLAGTVRIKFSDDKLDFEASDIRVKNESVSKVITVDRFEYKNGELDAKITANRGFKFMLGDKPASVTGGSVAYNHGKLSGEVTCEAELGHSKVAAKVGFKDGHLELDVGGEFDVAQFTGGRLKGRVKASTAGSVELLEEIRFAGELEKLSKIKIKKLSGDLKKGQFAIAVNLEDAMKDLAESWKLLDLTLKPAEAQLAYRGDALSITSHVGGEAKIKLGGRTVMSGAFELGYNNGFSAKVKLAKVDLENKYFKIRKGEIDTDAGHADLELDVNLPGVLKPDARITGAIDVKAGTFDLQGDFQLAIDALKDLQLHVGLNEKGVDIRAKLDGKKTFKLGPAELTLDAGSNLAYDGAKLAGSLSGTAKLGQLASGKFNFHVQGSAVTGGLHLVLNNLPMLKPGTVIDADFKDNQLNTKAIPLALDPLIGKFVNGDVFLQIVNNQIQAGGRIKEITGLGKLGQSVRDSHVTIDKESGDIDITGTINVAGVAGLKDPSQLTLGVVKGSFYIRGDLKLQSKGSLQMKGGFHFEWKDGVAKLKGGCEADLGGLAHLSIQVTKNPKEEGQGEVELPEASTDFKLSGKLTLQGLQDKYKSIRFSKPPEVCFWATAGNGELDYGMDDFETSIVQLPGVDSCNILVKAKYNKTNGFDAHVDLGTVKIKMFKLGGAIDIEQSKFVGSTLKIESDLAAVNLAGQITIHPGALYKFNAEARLDVKGDSASGRKWLESGNAHVAFKDGKLDSAGGKITLKKPPLLPLEKLTFEIEKRDQQLHGELNTEFEIPFGEDHKKGRLKATFGGDEGWSVAIDADIKPPGFKEGHLGGKVDGNGTWDVHADLHADGNKHIQAASLRTGYEEKRGFYLGGSVTLKINDKLSGEIDLEYNAKKKDFDFKGTVKRIDTPEPKVVKPLAGWRFANSIPLGGVGFVELFLSFFAGFSFNLEMPQVRFDELTVKGSLKSLLDGKLPEIHVKGYLNMGASAAFELGIGIGGRIELLIAEAEAGLTGTFTASAGLQIGAKVDGVLGGDHDGLDVDVDPEVTPRVELIAKLKAYFYARVFCFTIIDKTWKLGGDLKLGAFDLPKWAPFHKFTINVGGSGPTFKNGEPQAKTEKPPGLEGGSQKSGEDSSEQAKDAETKKNVRPVMEAIKTAGRKLEELPAPEKMTEPPSLEAVYLVPYDARQLYSKRREEAEQWFPELKAVTPGEKMAKSIAVAGWIEALKAKGALMGWRRAQIAHQGIDPDTGFNVVALRAQVQEAEDKKYAGELAAATAAQKAQDDEWAAAMQKQAEDLAKAEKEHEEKFAKTKRGHVEAVKQLEVEARIAQQKLEEAAKEARREGVKEQPTAEEKAPPPPPPAAPESPPPLRKPEPIAKKPPIPLPVAPTPLPAIIVPPLPTTIDDARDFGTDAPERPDIKPPTPPEPDPKPPAPPSSQGASEGSKAVSLGSGGGGSSMSKGGSGDLPTSASTRSGGGGGGAGGAAATVEGVANLGAQARSLVEKRLHMNEGGAAKAVGERPPSGVPGASALAAASVDPTVQRSVEAGKVEDDAQEKETQQNDEAFKQTIEQQKQMKGSGEARLKAAVARKHGGKMPADGEFPVGAADQARVAFSNWIRLGRSGETLGGFAEKMANRQYFDFEERVWRSVVGELKKIFEREGATPDPKEHAERLYTGHTWLGKEYKLSASFDASLSLSDESIRARETLDRLKALYRGNRAGDYLVAEAEKLDEAQKTSFINTKLAAIAGASEPMKALRLAIERLGPAAEVAKKLAEIDGGKSVNADEFWTQLGSSLDPSKPGMQQVVAAIQAVEARRAMPAGPTAPHDPAKDKKDNAPSMMRWADAEGAFAALDRHATLEALLAELGGRADRDLDANRAALLERRKLDLQPIAELMKGKRPEEIFRAWVEKNHKKTVELNRAVGQLATAYAEKIAELRREVPRLDADGVTRAAARFRRRIGSNTLLWSLGELNPAACKLEEKVDAAVALAPVVGADWNALLDPAWLSQVYEKFDATLFVKNDHAAPPPRNESKKPEGHPPEDRKQEARSDGKPAQKDPSDVADEKKASDEKASDEKKESVPTPEEEQPNAAEPAALDAAEAKLRTALKQCGDRWPARLQSMRPKEKLALAAKPERDIRKELFADFESLKPLMGPRAIQICRQLTEESGLAEGYEALPQTFAREVHESFLKGDAAADFEDLFAKVAKTGKGNSDGYLMKGKPIEKKDLDAVAPADKSLTCDLVALDEKVLRLSVVKADFEKERPSAESHPKALVAFALDKIRQDPVAHVQRYCDGLALVRLPSWSFPRDPIKSDAVFAESCDLGALYASKDAKGQLRMTLKREAVLKKLADQQLRRPTVFDGMLSPRWLTRGERDREWGVGGGGLREALMKIDWEDVDHTKWVCK
jgi:Domain of unknown function (DUF4157)